METLLDKAKFECPSRPRKERERDYLKHKQYVSRPEVRERIRAFDRSDKRKKWMKTYRQIPHVVENRIRYNSSDKMKEWHKEHNSKPEVKKRKNDWQRKMRANLSPEEKERRLARRRYLNKLKKL